jgi:hypothetical protein
MPTVIMYKTDQATGFRIFVRRFGLTLECGTPAPLCLAVHWFILLPGQSNSKAAQGRRSPKIAPQSQNTKSCFIALFELIYAVQVDKFTICKKREGVRSQESEWEPEKSEAH